MNDLMSNDTTILNISGKRGIVREFAVIIIGMIFLFGSAGTLYWVRGWIYICFAFLYQIIYISILLIINPQLLNERGNFNWKETKPYDKYFAIFYALFGFSMIIVAGLDAVRFQWSSIPFITIYPSIIVLILFCFIALWAYVSNSHFILTSRNDKLSTQRVCTIGPYRYIRHPAYLSAIITSLCYPFILGSLYSLIPVFLNIVLIIIRTYYEDKTLKIELTGYDEYSRKTKYRLFPYIW
ncbi:Isoprenylcysteine carboxyl methyltransferase (ICMT) family protein [uncultured archaeon]|nr:Isoprenylcysteine carboxyl methyltransferase (ICMT) family protein [uncultured archaeon]